MKRVIGITLSWLVVGGLVACGGGRASPPAPSPSPYSLPSPVAAPPTSSKVAPTPGDVVERMPSPTPAIPPVTDADWQIGPKDAPVTFVEYSDFQ